MLSDFKTFALRGNVVDLAVAVIIGGAFALITSSLTKDVIMPMVGALFGGLDFSNYFLRLGPISDGYSGSLTNYAELKEAGVPMLGYGQFITVTVNFVILAFVIFLLVRSIARAQRKEEAKPSEPGEEIRLLREIRDSLKASPRA